MPTWRAALPPSFKPPSFPLLLGAAPLRPTPSRAAPLPPFPTFCYFFPHIHPHKHKRTAATLATPTLTTVAAG